MWSRAPWGPEEKKGMGPKQNKIKIFGWCSRFPENISGGHFSENELVLFGGPRIIWRIKDPSGPIWRTKGHLVMKGLSKNVKHHAFKETHYSVRQKIGDPGSISTQNLFPLHSVTPKRPESPYGAKYCFFAEKQVFSVFLFFGPKGSLFWPHRTPVVGMEVPIAIHLVEIKVMEASCGFH